MREIFEMQQEYLDFWLSHDRNSISDLKYLQNLRTKIKLMKGRREREKRKGRVLLN